MFSLKKLVWILDIGDILVDKPSVSAMVNTPNEGRFTPFVYSLVI